MNSASSCYFFLISLFPSSAVSLQLLNLSGSCPSPPTPSDSADGFIIPSLSTVI